MEKMKLIVDTDIGDDIDDAFALALIIKSPEFDLLGVTTVYKNVELRAKIVKYMLDLANIKDVPVFMGIDKPLENDIVYWSYETETLNGKKRIRHYLDEMENVTVEQTCATDFLLSEVERAPDEITVVALGPLTNLASAYKKNPSAFRKIKQIIMMGGQVAGAMAEWNNRVDPEAAAIVLSSGVPIMMSGREVTLHCRLSDETIASFRKMDDPLIKATVAMMNVWMADNHKNPTLHDALAVASIVHDCCVFDKRFLRVELDGSKRGFTIANLARTNGEPEVEVALGVNPDSFMKFMKKRINTKKEQLI
jgi:inosine-uridine nucleoside N-ribohydrolase